MRTFKALLSSERVALPLDKSRKKSKDKEVLPGIEVSGLAVYDCTIHSKGEEKCVSY
jgi:hypothetical protein